MRSSLAWAIRPVWGYFYALGEEGRWRDGEVIRDR